MSKFNIGDTVRVFGRVGELIRYDEAADRLAILVPERNGKNEYEHHITHSGIELVEAAQPELPLPPVKKAAK